MVLLAYGIYKGVRYAQVREQRTKEDYAQIIYQIVREHYNDTGRVKLMQDNLNTHIKGPFYGHLPVHRTGELTSLVDFIFTPKRGSRLNMTEIVFSVPARQCPDQRIASIAQMKQTAQAWTNNRNLNEVKIYRSFTVGQP